MLKEPKQVPKESKVDTFQKYTQYFACDVSWINVDIPKRSTSFPSIKSFLLGACFDLNTSLLQSYCLIDFLILFAKIHFINCLLSTGPCKLLFQHPQCPKRGQLRNSPRPYTSAFSLLSRVQIQDELKVLHKPLTEAVHV